MNINYFLKKSYLFLLLLVVQPLMSEESTGATRALVQPGHTLVYKLKGDSFFNVTEDLKLTAKHLGENVDLKNMTQDNDVLKLGYKFVFVHPQYMGLSSEKKSVEHFIKNALFKKMFAPGVYVPSEMGLELKAKVSKTGWVYTIKMLTGKKDVFIAGQNREYHKIKSFSLVVDVTFNQKELRADKATLKYRWSVDPALNKKKTYSHNIIMTFDKIVGQQQISTVKPAPKKMGHVLKLGSSDAPRVVVPANSEIVYKVEGDSLFFKGNNKLILTEQYFGESSKPTAFLKTRDERFFQTFEFAFLHPKQFGINSPEITIPYTLNQMIDTRGGSYFPRALMLNLKGQSKPSGWSYDISINNDNAANQYDYVDGKIRRNIEKFNLIVDVSYDTDLKRVTKAVLNYKWSFKPSQDSYKNQKITITFQNQLSVKPLPKDRVAKAIELGRRYLMNQMNSSRVRQFLDGKEGSGKELGVGELALAFFAILRAGTKPNDPELEEHLLKFVDYAKHHGFMNPSDRSAKLGYSGGCVLMMCEAAINDFNRKSEGVSGSSSSKAGAKRINSALKSKLMSLARICASKLSAGSGHVWTYTGDRGTMHPAHYSPAQYAVLGLRSAKILGITVPNNVWTDIHKNSYDDFKLDKTKAHMDLKMSFSGGVINNSYKYKPPGEGKWGYSYTNRVGDVKSWGHAKGGEPSFNVTCAALGNLAMAYAFNANGKHKEMKAMMSGGLLYLQNTIDTLYSRLSYYEYYSFERVAVFYGITHIDGKDWHKIMSDKIVNSQNMFTGQFAGVSYRPLMATAYAVLFLKKGTKKLYVTSTIE